MDAINIHDYMVYIRKLQARIQFMLAKTMVSQILISNSKS